MDSKVQISRQLADELRSRFMETCLVQLNAYVCVKWLADVHPLAIRKSKLEQQTRLTAELAADQLPFEACTTGVNSSSSSSSSISQTLLKLAARQFGRLSLTATSRQQQQPSTTTLNDLVRTLTRRVLGLAWPMANVESSSSSLQLVRFMLLNCQYEHLSNYCERVKSWWTPGRGAGLRSFLLAHCCLFFDDVSQSIDLFLKASYTLDKDSSLAKFMHLQHSPTSQQQQQQQQQQHNLSQRAKTRTNNRRSIIITSARMDRDVYDNNDDDDDDEGDEDESDGSQTALLDYYTKVIRYYDMNGNVEAAIELVQNALINCRFAAECKSKLYCILFKSYMDLEYYERAHMAMMANFDAEWKRTCLRHFVAELCNRNRHAELVRFDYANMLPDVLDMLYRRAQASDLRLSSEETSGGGGGGGAGGGDFTYKVLYAMYVKSRDLRQAAFCMYECACRLRVELAGGGIESLRRQERCLLAAINLLKLCDARFRWLVVPDEALLIAGGANRSSAQLQPKELKARFEQCKDLLSCCGSCQNNSNNNNNTEFNNDDRNATRHIVHIEDLNRSYLTVSAMIKLATVVANQSTIGSIFLAVVVGNPFRQKTAHLYAF